VNCIVFLHPESAETRPPDDIYESVRIVIGEKVERRKKSKNVVEGGMRYGMVKAE
jgi:hypothetical protein